MNGPAEHEKSEAMHQPCQGSSAIGQHFKVHRAQLLLGNGGWDGVSKEQASKYEGGSDSPSPA